MAETFRKGDKVEWNSHGGKAIGTVEKKITTRTQAAVGWSMHPRTSRNIWCAATRAAAKRCISLTRCAGTPRTDARPIGMTVRYGVVDARPVADAAPRLLSAVVR